MIINKFDEYRVNEEFIGGLVKGSLGKLFKLFASPFKDLANDFKNAFKEEDPNSIKGIILKNFNQAIDSAQKALSNVGDESSINDIIDQMVSNLEDLGNNIYQDVDTAVGKNKSDGPKAVAKAVILGSKEASWAGIVGLLDPSKSPSDKKTNYKFSKNNYIKAIDEAGNKQGDKLKLKKEAANKFLDALQSDIKIQMDKDFSEDEVKRIYDAASKGKTTGGEYIVGDTVIYLLKGKNREDYDDDKRPEEQEDVVGVKKINKIEGDKFTFLDKFGNPTILKTPLDILGKKDGMGKNAKRVADSLGRIKGDEDKMDKIAKFSDFIQNPSNKVKLDQIDKIIGNG